MAAALSMFVVVAFPLDLTTVSLPVIQMGVTCNDSVGLSS